MEESYSGEDAQVKREYDRIRKRKKRQDNRLSANERRAILAKIGLVTVDDTAQALRVNREKLKALNEHGLNPITFSGEHVYAVADILPALQEHQKAQEAATT